VGTGGVCYSCWVFAYTGALRLLSSEYQLNKLDEGFVMADRVFMKMM
jgi:hypothetical protein